MDTADLNAVAQQVDAPECIVEWLDRFYSPLELDCLANPSKIDALGPHWERQIQRGVLTQKEDGSFAPANFHVRYWELDDYIQRHNADIETLKAGKLPPAHRIIPRYLLLDEALETVDLADHLFLWPCNCRSMMAGCTHPVYTCIRFDNAQGQGNEISKEKAKSIIIQANKKGLMQSGELGRDENGRLMGAICNCCSDCCFPHLMASECHAEKLWPISRYTAVFKAEDCIRCGRCVRRCPFDAFSQTTPKTLPMFDSQLCRGCGLCSETCPSDAIGMKRTRQL